MDYTTSALINSIRIKAMVPNVQSLFNDSDYLRILDEQLQTHIIAKLLAVKEEYLIRSLEVPIIENIDEYNIPERAIGAKLRDVLLRVGGISGAYRPLTRIEPEIIPFRTLAYTFNIIHSFYLKNNKVVIIPVPKATDGSVLIFTYYERPNSLVLSTACSQITAIDTNTKTVTVDKQLSSYQNGVLIDFVKNTPPFYSAAIDQAITATGTLTFTFAQLPTDLAIGDWVCLAKTSPVAQIPVELFPLLTQRVVVKLLEITGDIEQFKAASAELKELESPIYDLIENRTEGKLHKINNEYTTLRVASRSSRWLAW